MLDDPDITQYTHTLTVMAATHVQSVSSASTDITLEGKCVTHTSFFSVNLLSAGTSPPSDMEAVQHDLTSIIMTWTTSSDATGYRISYTSDSDSDSKEVGARYSDFLKYSVTQLISLSLSPRHSTHIVQLLL